MKISIFENNIDHKHLPHNTNQNPMKRLLLTLLALISYVGAMAQTQLWCENFDGATVSMTSSGAPGWSLDNNYQVSGPNCYRGQYSAASTVTLTSPVFSTLGNNFVILDFKQICKIEFVDFGELEFSLNNGATWTKLENGVNCTYSGSSNFITAPNYFAEGSYIDWAPGAPTAPLNTWWKSENFDISLAVGNQAAVQLRWKIRDLSNGMAGRYGWLLDDICVTGAPCELVDPTITPLPPIFQGNIYNLGPYDIFVDVVDQSGVQSAELFWTINGGPVQQFFGMFNLFGNQWAGQIPSVLAGDTVCWWVEAIDSSGCNNSARFPASGEICFIASDGISFPYCDNFDFASQLWTPEPTGSGTLWQIGPPTGPTLSTPNSPPNVMGVGDIGGTGSYLANSNSSIVSPVFDFSGVSLANLSFFQNRDCEGSWDGVRMEFTTNGGTTWNLVGTGPNDPNGVNWYTNASINSSSLPAWDGQSNGWIESRYKLGSVTGLPGAVAAQFRFVFTSDGSVQNAGFHIDDLCIKIPCVNDLGINLFDSPVPGSGQPGGATSSFSVTIENYGTSNQSNFYVYYSINGGAVDSTLFTNTLTPGQIATNFSVGTYSVPTGSYDICVWTDVTTDCDGTNDTACATFIGIPTLTPSPSYCDDFESGNIGWYNLVATGGNAGTIWELGAPAFGATSSANSGTNAWDVNLGTAPGPNSNCELYTPFFDFSAISAGRIEFAINYNIDAFGDGARLEYTTNGGVNWQVVGSGSTLNPDPCGENWYTNANIFSSTTPGWDGNSNGWQLAKYKLCCLTNVFNNPTPVQFRFVYSSDGFGVSDGISVDDFCIYETVGDDAGISAVTQPLSGVPAGITQPVTVTLENFGSTPLTSLPITYTINGGSPITFNWTGNLAPCANVAVVLPGFTVPTGQFTLCAFTGLTGDVDNSNDTTCVDLLGIPLINPNPSYCDNFESGNIGWYNVIEQGGTPGNNWELGLPAFGGTNSAFSGVNAWDINLTTGYTNNANTSLYSPFFDFSAIANARIEFYINYDTELNWDGARLEYTTDGGTTWTILGTGPNPTADPCGINWYNDNAINADNLPAWAGLSNGWVKVGYKLCCTTGLLSNATPIQWRFRFVSDGSVVDAGFSIDDFCIYAPIGDDVGITAITAPVGGAPVGTSQNVVVVLENFGSTTITSVPITFTVNGGNPQTITWTGSLAPCAVVTVVLPQTTFVQGVNTICAFSQLATDVDNSNDTTCADVFGQPIITPTYISSYFDNFDTGNIGWAPGLNTGADPTTNWEFGIPNFGSTSLAYTPPNAWDVNLNTAPGANANCFVTTPYFDFTNAQAAEMRFFQNRDMDAFGDQFFIEYSVNNGPWQLLQPTTQLTTNWYNSVTFWNDVSGGWIQSVFENVPSAVGGLVPLVQFRFVFTTDAFPGSDGVSVDNFEIFVPIPLSVTTLSVNTSIPNQLIFPGQPITFASPVRNNGVNTVFNHNITLSIDGGIVSVDPLTYTPTGLLPDSVRTHNFSNTWIAVPGFHEVCVYTDSPNGSSDLNPFDDTSCVTVLVFDSIAETQLPYCNSFESGNQWVTVNALSYRNQSIWELGTPAKTNLNSANTGQNAWTTKLTGTYANKDSSGLFSSLFRVRAGRCYKLSFSQEFRMEYGSDGGAVDYSTDFGVTWNRIDFTGSPNVQLFGASPNYTYITELDPTDPSQKGFTGIRNSWISTEKIIRPDVDAQLIVRWRFASDFSLADEGWSIDDVCFVDLGICSPLGVDEFAINDFGMSQNYPNPSDQSTVVEYMIPTQGQVRVVLSDMLGQVVSVLADGGMAAGKHVVNINTATLAPGIYTYTLTYEGQQITKKMMIAR